MKKLQVQCLAFQLKASWPNIVSVATKVHLSSQEIASVVLGFPAKTGQLSMASLPRKVHLLRLAGPPL